MNSIAHQLSRKERLIVQYLEALPNREFLGRQKFIAKAIGYTREEVNRGLRSLVAKGVVNLDYRIGVDARLKVISLTDGVEVND